MALWGKKEDTPPVDDKKEDKNQGKAEIDELVTRLGASFEEKLKPIREQVQGVVTDFNALKEAAARGPVRTNTNANGNEADEEPDPTLEPEKWRAKNLGPVLMQNALLAAKIAERDIRDSIPAQWLYLEPEVREILEKHTPVQRKAAPDYAAYVQNCWDLAIGRAAKKAGLKKDGDRFFIESAGSGPGDKGASVLGSEYNWVDKSGRVHTAEDTLSRLGIDPKEFAKSA